MRKYWIHYTYAKGRKQVRTYMDGRSRREVMSKVRKLRRDAIIVSLFDVEVMRRNAPRTILTTTYVAAKGA